MASAVDVLVFAAALVGLFLVSRLLLGVTRTVLSVILHFIDKRPIRVDLPIPGFPVDVVLVSDEQHMHILNKENARLSAVPYDSLQPLFGKFFVTSRFHSDLDDTWFVAFTQDKEDAMARRKIIETALDKDPHTWDDVLKVKALLEKKDFAALRDYVGNMVASRFVSGEKIPKKIFDDSNALCEKPPQALLNPWKAKAARAANLDISQWASTRLLPGLKTVDALHNIHNAHNVVPRTMVALAKNPRKKLEEIFTKKGDCTTPTPDVPRVALDASTYGGLLRYNAVPQKTIFLLQLGIVAQNTHNIAYTFGPGGGIGPQYRSCCFFPYWKRFMEDLQGALLEDSA